MFKRVTIQKVKTLFCCIKQWYQDVAEARSPTWPCVHIRTLMTARIPATTRPTSLTIIQPPPLLLFFPLLLTVLLLLLMLLALMLLLFKSHTHKMTKYTFQANSRNIILSVTFEVCTPWQLLYNSAILTALSLAKTKKTKTFRSTFRVLYQYYLQT